MANTDRRSFLFTAAENLPTLLYLLLLQQEAGLRAAGWTGSAAAALVFAGFAAKRIPPHPILLGINAFLLLAAPVIETVFALGYTSAGEMMVRHVETGVMLAVLACGIGLTVLSPQGFLAAPGLDPAAARRGSLLLLAICAAGAAWSLHSDGPRFVRIALPLIALYASRRLLLARIEKRPA